MLQMDRLNMSHRTAVSYMCVILLCVSCITLSSSTRLRQVPPSTQSDVDNTESVNENIHSRRVRHAAAKLSHRTVVSRSINHHVNFSAQNEPNLDLTRLTSTDKQTTVSTTHAHTTQTDSNNTIAASLTATDAATHTPLLSAHVIQFNQSDTTTQPHNSDVTNNNDVTVAADDESHGGVMSTTVSELIEGGGINSNSSTWSEGEGRTLPVMMSNSSVDSVTVYKHSTPAVDVATIETTGTIHNHLAINTEDKGLSETPSWHINVANQSEAQEFTPTLTDDLGVITDTPTAPNNTNQLITPTAIHEPSQQMNSVTSSRVHVTPATTESQAELYSTTKHQNTTDYFLPIKADSSLTTAIAENMETTISSYELQGEGHDNTTVQTTQSLSDTSPTLESLSEQTIYDSSLNESSSDNRTFTVHDDVTDESRDVASQSQTTVKATVAETSNTTTLLTTNTTALNGSSNITFILVTTLSASDQQHVTQTPTTESGIEGGNVTITTLNSVTNIEPLALQTTTVTKLLTNATTDRDYFTNGDNITSSAIDTANNSINSTNTINLQTTISQMDDVTEISSETSLNATNTHPASTVTFRSEHTLVSTTISQSTETTVNDDDDVNIITTSIDNSTVVTTSSPILPDYGGDTASTDTVTTRTQTDASEVLPDESTTDSNDTETSLETTTSMSPSDRVQEFIANWDKLWLFILISCCILIATLLILLLSIVIFFALRRKLPRKRSSSYKYHNSHPFSDHDMMYITEVGNVSENDEFTFGTFGKSRGRDRVLMSGSNEKITNVPGSSSGVDFIRIKQNTSKFNNGAKAEYV